MKPILFELMGLKVHSYLVFMILGYVAALGLLLGVTKWTPKEEGQGLSWPQVWDLFVVMVVSSVFGAKLGHVLFEAAGHEGVDNLVELLQADPWHWARLSEGGYVWYGGMIGALSVAVVYFRRRPHLTAWRYADAFAPAIMIGASVGRMGCFMAGCCYGVAAPELAWSIHFPGQPGPVHPTQLYDSFVALSLAVFLTWRFGRRRFDGENIALLLTMYPPLRFLTESFRGDAERGALGALSTSQIISIPLFALGLFLLVRGYKKTQSQL